MMLFVAVVQFAPFTGHVITVVVQLVRAFGATFINTHRTRLISSTRIHIRHKCTLYIAEALS